MTTGHAYTETTPRPAVPGSVWGYARISDARDGNTDSTDRQAWEIRKLAQSLGLPAPHMLVEQGSASRYASSKARLLFRRLIEAMEAGQVTDLLLWHADRWLRQPKELERLIDVIERCGTRVHAVVGGRVDLSSAEGRLQARVMIGVAAYESDHRSARVRAASQQRAERGGTHGGGFRPYGYDKTGMVIVPAEAAVVVEMTNRVITGESCRSVAADLRARGAPTVTGATWSALGLRDLLLRARNAGLREHGGSRTVRGELTEALWPAIVERSRWEACCGVLNDPSRKTSPGNAVTSLLSGIAHCPSGHPFLSGGGRNGRRAYRCGTAGETGHITRAADAVDAMVLAVLCGVEGQPGLLAHHGLGVTQGAPAEVSPVTLRAQADGLRSRLVQIEDAYADGVLSRAGLERNSARLQAEIAELERRAAVFNVPSALEGLEGVTVEQFLSLPLDRQRAVVRELLVITLHAPRPMGRKFDITSVEITPREQS